MAVALLPLLHLLHLLLTVEDSNHEAKEIAIRQRVCVCVLYNNISKRIPPRP